MPEEEKARQRGKLGGNSTCDFYANSDPLHHDRGASSAIGIQETRTSSRRSSENVRASQRLDELVQTQT